LAGFTPDMKVWEMCFEKLSSDGQAELNVKMCLLAGFTPDVMVWEVCFDKLGRDGQAELNVRVCLIGRVHSGCEGVGGVF